MWSNSNMKMFSADIPKDFGELDNLVREENYNLLQARNTLTKYIAFEYCLLDEIKDYEKFIEDLEADDIYENLRRKANGETDELKSKRMDFLLDKDKKFYQKPEFFRPDGPKWIDFEKEYVVIREEEINKIQKALKDQDIVFINGAPASGKSVILKSLAYLLLKDNDVYYFEIEQHSNFNEDNKYLAKLQHGYIFFDNAHLNREYANALVESSPSLSSSLKVLIATRDSLFNPYVGDHPLLKSNINVSIQVESHNVINSLINKYSKIYDGLTFTNDIINKFTNHNLWYLVWGMVAY